MKKISTLLIFLFLLSANLFSQTVLDTAIYTKVLYRVNVAGVELPSHDNTDVVWSTDTYDHPSPYSNYTTTGNKVFETTDPVSVHSSVPAGIPASVFKGERSIEGWDVTTIEWDFPVQNTNNQIEVRLFFTDMYFMNPGERYLDVYIENQLVDDDFDMVANFGHDVGGMRSYKIVSDENLDIDIKRALNQPVISGIEILELKEEAGAVGTKEQLADSEKMIFPNPFENEIFIRDLNKSSFSIFDISGNEVVSETNVIETSNGFKIDGSFLPKGIYFVKLGSHFHKIIKY